MGAVYFDHRLKNPLILQFANNNCRAIQSSSSGIRRLQIPTTYPWAITRMPTIDSTTKKLSTSKFVIDTNSSYRTRQLFQFTRFESIIFVDLAHFIKLSFLLFFFSLVFMQNCRIVKSSLLWWQWWFCFIDVLRCIANPSTSK